MSDRARYTTQAKADAKHSTLKAVSSSARPLVLSSVCLPVAVVTTFAFAPLPIYRYIDPPPRP